MSAKLAGKKRDRLGSRSARSLRAQGQIPASMQGEGVSGMHFSIDNHTFMTARRKHEHLFDIELGGKVELALVQELQWDALGDVITHVEFRRVIRGQETRAEVQLEFVGVAKGGVLNHLQTHITILAEPQNIPDSIEVKVSGLEPGHPLFARDLVLPKGVKLAIPPETSIAVVVVAKEVVVAPAPAAAEGAAPAAGATPAPEAKS